MLATEEKSEIALAEAALAAKAKLHAAEATLTGARIAHAQALREYFTVAGKLSDLRSVKFEGGKRIT